MRVLYHDPRRATPGVEAEYGAEYRTLEGILPESDFVTLHVDLRPETRGLINAERLAWMKPTAVLVNTSRGPVVESDALVDALRDGTIAAAALDVTDPEPLPADHALWTLDGVFITPHNAGDTPEAELAAHALARAQMLRYRAGMPLRHVISGSARPSR
jgi:glyoxylate reductase